METWLEKTQIMTMLTQTREKKTIHPKHCQEMMRPKQKLLEQWKRHESLQEEQGRRKEPTQESTQELMRELMREPTQELTQETTKRKERKRERRQICETTETNMHYEISQRQSGDA